MRQKISCWMVLVLVASVVPAFASEDRCTEPDIQTCMNHIAAKRTQGWLGIDFDRSDPNVIKVEAVTPYSPASKAGFKPGDVLLTLNGASFQDDVALARAKGDWKPGQVVTFVVKRPGYRKQLQVTLGKYNDHTFATMVGLHMLEYHVPPATAVSEAPPAEPTTTTR